jgi:hypothetical protein
MKNNFASSWLLTKTAFQLPLANFQNPHFPSCYSVKLVPCIIISLKTLSGVCVSAPGYNSISRVKMLWNERLRVKMFAIFSTSLALRLSSSHRHYIFYMRKWKSSVLRTTAPRAVHAESAPLCCQPEVGLIQLCLVPAVILSASD